MYHTALDVILLSIIAIGLFWFIIARETLHWIQDREEYNNNDEDLIIAVICSILFPFFWLALLIVTVPDIFRTIKRKIERIYEILKYNRGWLKRKMKARYWEARARIEEE